MNPQTRSLLVNRIVERLAILGPGPLFERFSVVFIEQWLGVTLIQRGSSINGSPVGGALDATTSDGKLAVEASIDKKYFGGEMPKPRNDLRHVLAKAPNAEKIYLLASQCAPTGLIEAFTAEVSVEDGMEGRAVRVMDGRAIAEVIIDELMLRDDAIDLLSEHLQVLQEIRDDHPASLQAPARSPLYVDHSKVDDDLDRRLATEICIEVCGVGGIGKSQAAAACLSRQAGNFEYRFWVRGKEISSVEDLSSVQLRRGGADRNVAALLRKNRTLVVLDDAPSAISAEQLREVCGPGSRILVTRRHVTPGAYEMPMMGEEQARELLGKRLDTPPTDAEFSEIWRWVGGHPLSLTLLNSAAGQGVAWRELADDCSHAGELLDDEGVLADRILGRMRHNLSDAFSVFVWLGQSYCDRDFLKAVIGTMKLRALEQCGLTAPEGQSWVRVHDIVFTSLNGGGWLPDQRSRVITDSLESYISDYIRDAGTRLQKIATRLGFKVAALVEAGDRRSAFLLALASIWTGSEIRADLLPDPVAMANQLRLQGVGVPEIDVLVVLETIEARCRYVLKAVDYREAARWVRSVIAAYEILNRLPSLSPRQIAEIECFHSKSLYFTSNRPEARQRLESLLDSYSLVEAKLLLVRIYTHDPGKHDDAKRLAIEILNEHVAGPGVSESVLMALGDVLNRFRSRWAKEILSEHDEMLLEVALYNASAGISQGYYSVSSYTRSLRWHEPHRVEQVVGRLPEPTPLMLDNDQSRAAYAEIMYHAAGEPADPSYLKRALDAFEALRVPDAFHLRRWGETLYALGRVEEAEELLETIVDGSGGRIWLAHSLSQVKLALGKADEALALVIEAIAGAYGEESRYRGSFLLQLAKVELALGRDPTKSIDEGLSCSDNERLRLDLESLRLEFKPS